MANEYICPYIFEYIRISEYLSHTEKVTQFHWYRLFELIIQFVQGKPWKKKWRDNIQLDTFFCQFFCVLLLCGLVSLIFTTWSKASAIYLASCDLYGDFGKKEEETNMYIISEKFLRQAFTPPIAGLSLLHLVSFLVTWPSRANSIRLQHPPLCQRPTLHCNYF